MMDDTQKRNFETMISNQTVGHQMGHTPQLPPPVQYPDGATQQQFPMQVPGQS